MIREVSNYQEVGCEEALIETATRNYE